MQGNEDLIIVHEALDYGDCRLSLAVSNFNQQTANSVSILNFMFWKYDILLFVRFPSMAYLRI